MKITIPDVDPGNVPKTSRERQYADKRWKWEVEEKIGGLMNRVAKLEAISPQDNPVPTVSQGKEEKMTKESKQEKELRAILGNFLMDIDNEARIDSKTANAMVDVYIPKITDLLTAQKEKMMEMVQKEMEGKDCGFCNYNNTLKMALDDLKRRVEDL